MIRFKTKKKQSLDLDTIGIKVKQIGYRARLDKVFSIFIRLRDSSNGTFRCISCGQIKEFAQADCGHYINRQHMSLRYSEINCNAQCRKCNRFDEGNNTGYRRGLISKHGEQKVLVLESAKSSSRKYSDFEYCELIKYYKAMVKELKEQRGL